MFRRLVMGMSAIAVGMVVAGEAKAHGERAQEAFLRTRSLHFFDMKFPKNRDVKINDTITVSGKVRVFKKWPDTLDPPDTAYLTPAVPGPVFVREESWIGGVSGHQSMSLVRGRTYSFTIKMRARVPGRYHVHPMITVLKTGGLLGPGVWVNITGDPADFRYPLTTVTGEKIENLATYGVPTVVKWHIVWIVIGVAWLLWWIRRPLFIPRMLAVRANREEGLVTTADRLAAVAFFVGTVAVIIIGYQMAQAKYPNTIPLQSAKSFVEPLPVQEKSVKIKVITGKYFIPGRSMSMVMKVTNNTDKAVRAGEFYTANIRFLNNKVPQAAASVPADYPKELLAPNGLTFDDERPIQPGETRTIAMDTTDVAWEIERLGSLINDPSNTLGGLMMFYAADGTRTISEVFGPVIPVFPK